MRNRILAMLLAAVLCLGIIGVFIPSALAFSDISGSEVSEAVSVLSGMGIVSGYSDGKYHPADPLTRSQFCKLAVLIENHGSQLKSSAYRALFSDVGSGHWALSYVNLAYTEGLVQGYGNGTFGPDDVVTCGQAVTIALRILGYTTDDIGPFWPEDYMEKAAALGLLDGISKGADAGLNRGEAALLLYHLLNQTTADGKDYLATYATTTATSAVVLSNDAEADDGYLHAAQVYANGSVTYYEQTNVVDDGLIGNRGTLLLDKTGAVIGFVPGDSIVKTVTVSEVTASAITDSSGNSYTISSSVAMVMDGEKTTYGSGWYDLDGRATVNILYSDSGSIDLVVASDSERYSGILLTGYYENANPSASNPSAITIAGLTLDVADGAAKSLAQFSVGVRMTVALNAKGEVAAAYTTDTKSGEMIGVLGSGNVTLTNGLVLSGTISSSLDAGTLVKVTSSGVGKLSVSALNSETSSKLDVENATLGSVALADNAVIYERVNSGAATQIRLSDILTAYVAGTYIDYVHTNSAGQIDILLLDDVTGNRYTYGIFKATTQSGGSGTMTYENTKYAITNSDGTTSGYASAAGITAGTVGGLAISDEAGKATGYAALTKITGVTRSDFDGGDFVIAGGATIPISSDVQVYNETTEAWVTLTGAKAFTNSFTIYYDRTLTTGAQVRVIYAQ